MMGKWLIEELYPLATVFKILYMCYSVIAAKWRT